MSITQATLKTLLGYCPETGVFTWKVRKHRAERGSQAGCLDTSKGYWRVGINGSRYLAHRLAWFYVHGVWPPEQVDHINGDRADNRLSNLRLATHAENLANRGASRNAASRYKGVHRSGTGWQARIGVNGTRQYLGRFKTEEEAHAAYRQAAITLHGAFARTS